MSEFELKQKMVKSAMSAIIDEAAHIASRPDNDIPAQKALEIASNLCAKMQGIYDGLKD